MIIGIGIDLVEAKRIQKLLDEYADRFAARVLNSEEREYYERSSRPMWFLANRFAAKEALSKALGTGLRYPVTLHSIGVISTEIGRPEFSYSEALKSYLESRNVTNAHLSITHEKGLVCAVVVLEARE
jgi:holo-[acyl-carrier protein] synthase